MERVSELDWVGDREPRKIAAWHKPVSETSIALPPSPASAVLMRGPRNIVLRSGALPLIPELNNK